MIDTKCRCLLIWKKSLFNFSPIPETIKLVRFFFEMKMGDFDHCFDINFFYFAIIYFIILHF